MKGMWLCISCRVWRKKLKGDDLFFLDTDIELEYQSKMKSGHLILKGIVNLKR